jgi:hypothetical protein
MATWSEVRKRLSVDFRLDADEPEQLTLTLPLADGRARRAQRVLVQHLVSWGAPMVEIRSAFGEIAPGESEVLLASNLDLPLGAVARHGRFLVLVQRLPLEGCSIEAVLWTLSRMAELADVLEERRGGDRF